LGADFNSPERPSFIGKLARLVTLMLPRSAQNLHLTGKKSPLSYIGLSQHAIRPNADVVAHRRLGMSEKRSESDVTIPAHGIQRPAVIGDAEVAARYPGNGCHGMGAKNKRLVPSTESGQAGSRKNQDPGDQSR
jgi:hypothetical protein